MERRKFLIGAGSTAIGTSALVGSGAFSTMSSGDREFAVNVASDSQAYIGLFATSQYAYQNEDGKLELAFDDTPGTQAGADGGVNPQSTYTFNDVFEIRTQHQQGDTYLYIELEGFDEEIDVELSAGSTEPAEGGEDLTDSDELVKLFEPDTMSVDVTIESADSAIGEAGGTMTVYAATGADRDQL